jgi:2-iminobutanoate/2-iminopropanoate deaminase
MVFISGQTPRARGGQRLIGAPFEQQARVALDDPEAIARFSGPSLRHAVKVDVFLRDLGDRAPFDAISGAYIGEPPQARTLVQCKFTEFDVEVSAVLLDQRSARPR